MRAEEKEGERKGKENQETEKSSTELFALLQKSSSLHSLVSIKRAFDMRRVEDGHFRYSAFSEEDASQTWIRLQQLRDGFTAREERKTVCFFLLCFWEESRLRVWSLPGRCGFFAETLMDADAKSRVWERDRKHHDEVRWRVEKEAHRVWRECVYGGEFGGNIA
ncbi:hypothetical protein ABVT39_010444 [Epinephelus coioides]